MDQWIVVYLPTEGAGKVAACNLPLRWLPESIELVTVRDGMRDNMARWSNPKDLFL